VVADRHRRGRGGHDPAGQQQAGDTRIFRTGRSVSRERITGLIPGRRFSYEVVGGQFFRSYYGVVELAEAPQGGTDITWSATFEPKLPLSGPFWSWYLTRFQQRMADGLAQYASQARHQNTM
jgi:Polyketide cyclase / dehydrase and lipid transport